jgi:hypothetical protein
MREPEDERQGHPVPDRSPAADRADGLAPAGAERPLVVQDGRILAYRLLDVADEIDLVAAQSLAPTPGARRGALSNEGARSLVIASPPLEVALEPSSVSVKLSRGTRTAAVSARVFAYGAISIAFELAIPDGSDLAALAPMCDEIYESPEFDRIARELVEPLLDRLAPAVDGRHHWEGIETYTIVYVQRFRGDPSASQVLASPALASLVIGEPPSRKLSARQRRDVLEHSHSYFEDDLVVVDWDSAFVLEPSGSRDIPDILELASSQLLELRYYDDLFDAELARVHRQLERVHRRRFSDVLSNPWLELGRGVVRRLVELTEFAERVDNALKVVGDFYLARVYESAVRRFRIRAWQASIDAKQGLLAQAYGLIRGEVEARRSTVLELVVIILIVVEVVLALSRH